MNIDDSRNFEHTYHTQLTTALQNKNRGGHIQNRNNDEAQRRRTTLNFVSTSFEWQLYE